MTSNKTVFSNFIWRLAERCGAQIVSFVVSIVLARILLPEDYGTVALITVFLTILQVFVDSGLGSALIQKKDAEDLEYSTVFYFNFVLCLILYAGMYIAAPYIAKFYNKPELTAMTRVISLTLVISGVKNIQQAYVSKHMIFKKFFFSTLGGTVFSAFFGIYLAYKGYGAWALIGQNLSNACIDTLILWITVKWRPKLMFSFEKLKTLFSYGWKLLASGLLDTIYNNLRQLVIGKVYSSTDLAYYNRGQQFPNLIITNVNTAIDSVLFPAMASEQDDLSRVKAMTRRSIKVSSFVIWPAVIGLAACAEPIVRILLTDKWLPCVPYLQIFCFTYGFWPVHTANLNAIKAVGRSDLFLKLEIEKKVIGLLSILVSLPFGVMPMTIAYAITSPISAMINAAPNRKLLNYGYREQIADMLPSMLLSGFMGAVLLLINKIPLNPFFILVMQILTGILIYVIGAKILHFDSLQYLLSILKSRKKEGQ